MSLVSRFYIKKDVCHSGSFLPGLGYKYTSRRMSANDHRHTDSSNDGLMSAMEGGGGVILLLVLIGRVELPWEAQTEGCDVSLLQVFSCSRSSDRPCSSVPSLM